MFHAIYHQVCCSQGEPLVDKYSADLNINNDIIFLLEIFSQGLPKQKISIFSLMHENIKTFCTYCYLINRRELSLWEFDLLFYHRVRPCFDTGDANHYNDVIMDSMASQITSLTIVYSAVYSGVDQRTHQSFASLAFVRRIHRDR